MLLLFLVRFNVETRIVLDVLSDELVSESEIIQRSFSSCITNLCFCLW